MIQYDPHHWRSHFFDIRGSLVREIVLRVSLCVVWAAFVVLLDRFQLVPAMPATAHMLVGGAIGLLLVFRTNSSYDRFWEGRKQWGSIVNTTRNLARQSANLLAGAPEIADRVILWTAAFASATMYRLRGEPLIGDLEPLLPADGVQRVQGSNHIPLAISREIGDLLNQAKQAGVISDIQQMSLDSNVGGLLDCLGACERIHSTPMPFAYAVHLRRSILAFCLTIPFVLAKDLGWSTIPAVFLISYVYFGVEEIGVEIEDPFGVDENDLPLEAISSGIERTLRGLMLKTAAGGAISSDDPS